eukprot:9472756-Heterocapsa_arctica.AAC.1
MDNVYLAQIVQYHMVRTYKRYITNPLVRKDIESDAKIKGAPEGTKRAGLVLGLSSWDML